MRILYVKGEYDFCYYYRGYLPGVYSNQMVMPIKGEVSPSQVAEQAKEADVIVFQRPKDKKRLELLRILKKMGKKVIYENDDSYLVGKGIMLERLESDKQREIAIEMSQITNQILMECDGAIASTPLLAEEYSKVNKNVVVLKNCIDPLDEWKSKPNVTGKFRVGFVGSVTTNDDYIHIKEDIKKLDERGDVTIVVNGVKYKDGTYNSFMTGDYLFWNSLKNVEWHPYVHVTEYMSNVASLALDLVLIPRVDSYFNRCKSNLKFLEMSLLKIPVLAQGFSDGGSPYQGKDEKYMTVIQDSWYDKVIEIKDNYRKYKKLSEKAYKYVLKNYNINTYAPKWSKEIKKLCK